LIILRKFFNKSKHANKNNDGLFVALITIFTTLILLINIVQIENLSLILIALLFTIAHFTMEIFDKNRSYRIVKAGLFTLLAIDFAIYILQLTQQTGKTINLFPATHDALLIQALSFLVGLYVAIYLYSTFIGFLLRTLINSYDSLNYDIIKNTFLIGMLTNVIATLFLYILVFVFKDYGFKNNNNINRRFVKNEKYNATNAKSPANAKRYGKPARRD
jgi:hypothetical protein